MFWQLYLFFITLDFKSDFVKKQLGKLKMAINFEFTYPDDVSKLILCNGLYIFFTSLTTTSRVRDCWKSNLEMSHVFKTLSAKLSNILTWLKPALIILSVFPSHSTLESLIPSMPSHSCKHSTQSLSFEIFLLIPINTK